MEFITTQFDRNVDRSTFDCGKHEALNRYIRERAGQDEKRHLSRTFMFHESGQLVGYYTLASTSVALTDLDEAMTRKLPRYTYLPAILLSRLAVDKAQQGKGLGQRLVSDFFRRVYAILKHAGAAFIVVDAKDEDAARYYRGIGFVPVPNQALLLVLPTATIVDALARQEASSQAEQNVIDVAVASA
jgi:predicted N-acetyltransferase YhbS